MLRLLGTPLFSALKTYPQRSASDDSRLIYRLEISSPASANQILYRACDTQILKVCHIAGCEKKERLLSVRTTSVPDSLLCLRFPTIAAQRASDAARLRSPRKNQNSQWGCLPRRRRSGQWNLLSQNRDRSSLARIEGHNTRIAILSNGSRQGESSSQRITNTVKVDYVDRGSDVFCAAGPLKGRKSKRLRGIRCWEPKATGRSVLLSWLMSSIPIGSVWKKI